jgi:hypothetical protein
MTRRCLVLQVACCLLSAGAVGRPARCEQPTPDRAAVLAELKKYDCWVIDDRTNAASEIKVLRFGCHSELPDSALGKLAAFPELEFLSFISDNITDDGLVQLKNLPKLKTLYINSSLITDQGLRSLRDVPKLEELMLMRTQVTARGLAEVQALRGLKTLKLIRLKVTPELIEQLKRFQHLDKLSISQTTLTDQQQRELTEMLPNLSIN